MDDFQEQQAERDHLYILAAEGYEELDNFITKRFTEKTVMRADMFTFRDKWINYSFR